MNAPPTYAPCRAPDQTIGRRAAPRVRLGVPAEVLLLQGLETCLLDDLSRHGARIAMDGCLPRPGSGAVLQAHGVDAFGTVVWTKAQRLGVQFDEALPLDQVVAIRHFADAYAETEAARRARVALGLMDIRRHLR